MIVVSRNGGAERRLQELFASADIRIDGDRPWDIRVHDREMFARVLKYGPLGFGEAYMEGHWDCDQLDQLFTNILRANLSRHLLPHFLPAVVMVWATNRQTRQRSRRVADVHYNIGNDLYRRMLDKRMQYTCAYWKGASTLDEAQEHKLELICRKLHLRPGMRVLELGGGFGGLAHYLAEKHHCEVVSYNISDEQVKYARELCRGLPVEIVHKDYREATGEFDRVVSVGLAEHVGPKNYRSFFELACRCLRGDGLFLLHTIGNSRTVLLSDPWIRKYIFPEGYLPSAAQLGAAMDELFVMEDWHNFGPDYDRTLKAWHANFTASWQEIAQHYDERFRRMWCYYLLSCAGGFRSRRIQLWQIVMSKGLHGGYVPVR